MNKLLLLSVLGLAACTEARGVHGDWAQGARFAPSSATEYRARALRGEPGVFPAPSGYSVYTEQQRIAAGAASSDGVLRQGTASSRTGEFITANFAGASSVAGSSHQANASVAAQNAGKGTRVTLAGQSMEVAQVDVGSASYAIFNRTSGRMSASTGPSLEAALPQLTGCSKAAGPFNIGTQTVYALTCS